MDAEPMYARVVAIVPAHNEEGTIEEAAKRLAGQTVPLDIIVVSDNSTDRTEEVARRLESEYPQLKLFVTQNNRAKKAGALNQALLSIEHNDYEFVLAQDADTVLDRQLVEKALEVFKDNDEECAHNPKCKKLAAVCSRAGVLAPPRRGPNTGWWNRFLWKLQKFEYSTFDAARVETLGQIKVVHGMAAVYRMSSMLDVAQKRFEKWGVWSVYDETNIIEDFELTLWFKELGFAVTASMDMFAWTSVPMTLKELWNQRLRWFRGSLDALADHGFNRVTLFEYWQHAQFVVLTTASLLIVVYLAFMIINGDPLVLNWLTFAVIGYYLFFNAYRLRYVQDLDWVDAALVFLYVPHSLYHQLYQVEIFWAYALAAWEFVRVRVFGREKRQKGW